MGEKIFQFEFSFSFSPRANNKFLSPATCPSSPWTPAPPNGFPTSTSSNEFNPNGNSYSHSTSMLNTSFQFNNESLADQTEIDTPIQLIPDDLQSSTKEGKRERTSIHPLWQPISFYLIRSNQICSCLATATSYKTSSYRSNSLKCFKTTGITINATTKCYRSR